MLDKDEYNNGQKIIREINKILYDKFKIGHVTIQIEMDECARPDLLCNHNDNHREESSWEK